MEDQEDNWCIVCVSIILCTFALQNMQVWPTIDTILMDRIGNLTESPIHCAYPHAFYAYEVMKTTITPKILVGLSPNLEYRCK